MAPADDGGMYLRAHKRWKNGRPHRYLSVVENRRAAGGKVVQRTVLYLGEINDSQQAAWRKTLEVFDETRSESRQLSLFPDDRRPAGKATPPAGELPLPAVEGNSPL